MQATFLYAWELGSSPSSGPSNGIHNAFRRGPQACPPNANCLNAASGDRFSATPRMIVHARMRPLFSEGSHHRNCRKLATPLWAIPHRFTTDSSTSQIRNCVHTPL